MHSSTTLLTTCTQPKLTGAGVQSGPGRLPKPSLLPPDSIHHGLEWALVTSGEKWVMALCHKTNPECRTLPGAFLHLSSCSQCKVNTAFREEATSGNAAVGFAWHLYTYILIVHRERRSIKAEYIRNHCLKCHDVTTIEHKILFYSYPNSWCAREIYSQIYSQ